MVDDGDNAWLSHDHLEDAQPIVKSEANRLFDFGSLGGHGRICHI